MNEFQGASAVQREPFFDPQTMKETPELEPLGLVSGPVALELCEADAAFALAGGPLAFTHARLGGQLLSAAELRRWAEQAGMAGNQGPAIRLEALTRPRSAFAGVAMSGEGARPRIMGVCNVTPDSFSDGGDHADPHGAINFARRLVAAGAEIIDVGGESTRPGAAPVSRSDELARVLPVVEALAGDGVTVSIDTRHAETMQAAIEAGAAIINDVAALTAPGALEVAARSDAAVILMHMRGTPETMQDRPDYGDVVQDVYGWLADRVAICLEAGIGFGRLAVDPGFGFGKTVEHNAELLRRLTRFHGLGCPLAVGLSRKSFIGVWTGEEDPKERIPGSLAAAIAAVEQGAQIVRVHDVAETRAALSVWRSAAGLVV